MRCSRKARNEEAQVKELNRGSYWRGSRAYCGRRPRDASERGYLVARTRLCERMGRKGEQEGLYMVYDENRARKPP